jgi:hypothetical protein
MKRKKPKIICSSKVKKSVGNHVTTSYSRGVGGDFTNQKSRHNEVISKNKLPKSYVNWLDL